MPKVNSVELSQEAVRVLRGLISELDSARLKQLATGMHGGFRDPNAIKSHFLSICESSSELPTNLKHFCRTSWKPSILIDTLSAAAISECLHTLRSALGDGELYLALLLDNRNDVQALIQQLSRDIAKQSRTEPAAEAIKVFVDLLSRRLFNCFEGKVPFVRVQCGLDHNQDPAVGSVSGLAEIEVLFAQCQKDRDSFEEALKNSETRSKEAAARVCSEMEHRLSVLNARADTLAQRLDSAVQDASRFESLLKKERAHRQELIDEGVELQLSAIVRPWLEEARRLQGLSVDRTDKSLMERAATILHAQEALDMKHGSRTRLRRRLKEFEDYASKIRSVLEDSIKPSEDLAPLLAEFEGEIHRTRVILGEDRPPSPLVSKLEEAIHKASTSESLDSLADNIAALHDAGVFTHKEHLRLTKQQLKAYDRLRTRYELKVEAPQRRSGWELCQVVGSNKKAVVCLDGNNVLHRDDRYAHLFPESGKMNKDVEDALLSDVRAVAAKSPAAMFRVVFDSHTESIEEVTDNVVVQRSGGSGTNRADSAIVLHLAKADHGIKRFVITDDNELRQQATKLGGVYADVAIWDVLLDALVPTATLTPCDIPA